MPVKTHTYSNKDITITWKPDVCIHSKICWHNLRSVFDPARRPWIMPDAADTATIMAQIDKCPSGALGYTPIDKSGEPSNVADAMVSSIIECLPNGPLLINGEVMVKKPDGTEEVKSGTVALCRCGGSKNKPYCDGSHVAIGFEG